MICVKNQRTEKRETSKNRQQHPVPQQKEFDGERIKKQAK
jgi:hypothetical protein